MQFLKHIEQFSTKYTNFNLYILKIIKLLNEILVGYNFVFSEARINKSYSSSPENAETKRNSFFKIKIKCTTRNVKVLFGFIYLSILLILLDKNCFYLLYIFKKL